MSHDEMDYVPDDWNRTKPVPGFSPLKATPKRKATGWRLLGALAAVVAALSITAVALTLTGVGLRAAEQIVILLSAIAALVGAAVAAAIVLAPWLIARWKGHRNTVAIAVANVMLLICTAALLLFMWRLAPLRWLTILGAMIVWSVLLVWAFLHQDNTARIPRNRSESGG